MTSAERCNRIFTAYWEKKRGDIGTELLKKELYYNLGNYEKRNNVKN